MENENPVADSDLVVIAKPDRLLKAAVVQESPVAASQIDQPKFADILHIDDRVPA